MDGKTGFDHVVFAGGGNRCLWQVGFWEVAAREIGLAPKTVAAVSAGAAMACMILSGGASESFARFSRACGANKRNMYPENLFRKQPVFPHFDMFARAMLETVDAAALARIQAGPELRILMARPPAGIGARTAAVAGILAYSLEKAFRHPVHATWTRRLGFRPLVVRATDCRTPRDLARAVLCSSCTPPVTPLLRYRGAPVLDGGLVDNVPLYALDDVRRPGESVLVMLTRALPGGGAPDTADVTYVWPSRPIRINKWDYTNPEGQRRALEQGRRDAEAYLNNARQPIR
ncbi:MAG: patatin-like phospholipase family protein [Desulfatibacillaceae bacterium]